MGTSLGQWALAQAFPPRCPACHESVDTQHNFCQACFSTIKHIAAPLCQCCGIPFAFDVGADARCPECLAEPPQFDTARAPMVYDAISSRMVHALKFHDRYTGVNRAVRMMTAALDPQYAAIDIIVPVPLHWRRLLMRRYNQAALLAYGLAAQLNTPCAPHALKRTRYTRPQMRMKRAERITNARHLFAVQQETMLRGKNVLLVDDVITTGATINACAAAMKKAGAAQVHAISLARTVRA